jgi:hypothetical protein
MMTMIVPEDEDDDDNDVASSHHSLHKYTYYIDRCCGQSCVFKCRSYLARQTFRYHLPDAGKCFRDHHGLPRGRSGMLLGRNLLFLAPRTLLIVYSAFLLALHARLSTPSSLDILRSIRPLPFSTFC